MSKTPSVQEFKLSIDQDPDSPQISVEDLTAHGPPEVISQKIELPVFIAVDHAPGTHAELKVRPATPDEPFDPELTRDGNVLAVETEIADELFDTWDDTRYLVRVTNRSHYYVAEDISVAAELAKEARDVCELPDGNLSLVITPREQHIGCIGPGKSAEVRFVAISRGTPRGLYPVDIVLKYRLLYWDGRIARAVSRQVLPVQTPRHQYESPKSPTAVPMPRQPSSRRSNAMPDPDPSAVFPPEGEAPMSRVLEPIEVTVELSGGGHLKISYRLTKNNYPHGSHAPGSYGMNPKTKSVESYFSTQDTAALELKVENACSHDIKHLRISHIRLAPFADEGGVAAAHHQKLPDGNLLFEVIPSEVYYGHLKPGEKEVRYLSLITRGVAPGKYAIHLTANYDIEQCKVPCKLWLKVNPD